MTGAWRRTTCGGNKAEVYHTDRSCPYWPANTTAVDPNATDLRECKRCGDSPRHRGGDDMSYYQAAVEAGQ